MIVVRIIAALALVASLAAGCTSTSASGDRRTRPVPHDCPPAFFGVPGSAEGVQNAPPDQVPPTVSRADARRYGATIGLLKTELARIAGPRLATARAIDYPATPLSSALGPVELLAALAASERHGVAALLAAIHRSYAGGCPARPVLLAGYSQGAEVVIQAVRRLTSAEQAHVAVALFGNPSRLPGLPGDLPAGTRAAGVRPSLTQQAFRLPAAVRHRSLDICAPGDGVCAVGSRRASLFDRLAYVLAHGAQHSRAYAFGHNGYARRAARFLWAHR
jgi:hypothetical protein